MVPVPVVTVAPGVLVSVQVPEEGNPLRITLPVATAQVGCVIVPMVGAVCTGWALTTTLADADETHPDAFVTL